MILDFIWQNFGFIEYLLCIELVILVTAGFFYQIAKFIMRTDRQDPLVKFYRVFWQAFFSSVTSMRDLDLIQAKAMARSAGFVAPGDLDEKQLSRLDAPDLGDLASMERAAAVSASEPENPDEAPSAKPVGRAGPEDEDKIRPSGQKESRELRYAREQKEKRAQETTPAPRPAPREEELSAAPTPTGRMMVRIIPFSPRDEIAGRQGEEVVVNVVCAPEDGHANATIIQLIAARTGVRPYQISLLGGHYKVRKTLQIAGLDQDALDSLLERI